MIYGTCPGPRSPDYGVPGHVEERPALLGVRGRRCDLDGVPPGPWPAPGEQHRVRERPAGTRLVLPDPGLVKRLAAVDEHLGVAVGAALLPDRADDGDGAAGETERDRGVRH